MTRKLDKEHLEAIQTLRESFSHVTMRIGSIAMEEIMLQRQLESIQQEKESFINEMMDLQKQETDLINTLRERYGDGEINTADGTFTSNS